MAKTYPIELRQRVLKAYDDGRGSIREVAELFGVSGVWIKKLLRQRRETGSIAPIEYQRGPKPKLSEDQRDRLCRLAADQPDLTLDELRRKLRLRCSIVTVWRALKQMGPCSLQAAKKRSPFKLANNFARMFRPNVSVGVVG